MMDSELFEKSRRIGRKIIDSLTRDWRIIVYGVDVIVQVIVKQKAVGKRHINN